MGAVILPSGAGDEEAPACVRCGRPGLGVWRPAPPGGVSLPVCDVDWQLAGGLDATDDTVVLRDPDPTDWARSSAVAWEDDHESGPAVAEFLRRGVRWHLLRWIEPASRWMWLQQLRQRQAPAGTRAVVEGGQLWLDGVAEIVAAQGWQARRQCTWMRFAEKVADAVPVDGGAVTRSGCTVPELAEHIGCSEDYVSDIIRWFVDQGLLHVLVPGDRKKAMATPSDETPEEAAERQARVQAAVEAKAARAKAVRERVVQLDVWRDAPPPAIEVEHGCPYLRTDASGERWVHIAQVYELRLPAPSDAPELPAAAWGDPKVTSLGKARRRRTQARRGTLRGRGVQPGRAAALAGQMEKSGPNDPDQEISRPSSSSAGVEERAAPPRSYEAPPSPARGSNQATRPPSRVVRSAQRLLGRVQKPGETPVDERLRTLPPQLRAVTVAWLARRIARHVLAGWTDRELVCVIALDGGRHMHCSPSVRNPQAFIAAALRRWPADTQYRTVDQVEQAQTVRQAVDAVEVLNEDLARSRDTRARRIRQAIDECPRCDGDGLVERPARHAAGVVVERCDHQDPDPLAEVPIDERARLTDALIEDTLAKARAHREQRLAAEGLRPARRAPAPTRGRRQRNGAWGGGHDFDPRDRWR